MQKYASFCNIFPNKESIYWQVRLQISIDNMCIILFFNTSLVIFSSYLCKCGIFLKLAATMKMHQVVQQNYLAPWNGCVGNTDKKTRHRLQKKKFLKFKNSVEGHESLRYCELLSILSKHSNIIKNKLTQHTNTKSTRSLCSLI